MFTVLWAAFNPVLMFMLLRELVRRGYSRRSLRDDLWLTALLGVGSVYYTSAVLGQVWYTAHVVAVTITILYAWASLDAKYPAAPGCCWASASPPVRPLGYMFPLFLWEAVRVSGGWKALWDELAPPPPAAGRAVPTSC